MTLRHWRAPPWRIWSVCHEACGITEVRAGCRNIRHATVVFGEPGAANWQGAVADPETATLYVSYAVSPGVAGLISDPDQSSMRYVLKNATVDGPFDLPLLKPPWG